MRNLAPTFILAGFFLVTHLEPAHADTALITWNSGAQLNVELKVINSAQVGVLGTRGGQLEVGYYEAKQIRSVQIQAGVYFYYPELGNFVYWSNETLIAAFQREQMVRQAQAQRDHYLRVLAERDQRIASDRDYAQSEDSKKLVWEFLGWAGKNVAEGWLQEKGRQAAGGR